MNILNLLDSFDIDQKSKEEKDIYMSRKEAFRKLSHFTKRAALASLPLGAFSAMPQIAFAQDDDVIGVLNFALLLERLEYNFYLIGCRSDVIAAEDRDVFTAIRDHELIHVNLLEDTISSLGGEPVPKPEFDFTAGGIFPNPFENYPIFLALSQGFEDTGVRAYKGQAPKLIENDNLLRTALQIHSLEARHAAQVRRLRGRRVWITKEDYDGIEGFEAATAPIYAGEMNTTHMGIDVTTVTKVPELAVEEAWDEPLTREAVLAIVDPFVVQ